MEGEDLSSIREELDEHLDALNQNTGELSAVYEHVCEIDARLEKLVERVDALQALILSQNSVTQSSRETRQVKLTQKERGVLQALRNSAGPVTSIQVGKLVGLTSDLAAQTIFVMSQKGVPIEASSVGEITYYSLVDEHISKNKD